MDLARSPKESNKHLLNEMAATQCLPPSYGQHIRCVQVGQQQGQAPRGILYLYILHRFAHLWYMPASCPMPQQL